MRSQLHKVWRLKIYVKFLTIYNKNVNSDYEIKSLKEFDEIIEKL